MEFTENLEEIVEDILNAADENAEDSFFVNGESYASRAARTSGTSSIIKEQHVWPVENNMPQRPRTAFFTPNKLTTARSVLEALAFSKVEPTDVQCLQRKLNGGVVVTVRSITAKENFLRLNSLHINSENYVIQDVDKP